MSEEEIFTKIIILCINTLNSDAMTQEEEALGYFTQKKLKNLLTRKEWKAGEKKQINQFMMQGMFGDPIYPIGLPKNIIILCLHWQYLVKCTGVQQSQMCCNGSKCVVPQLHAVASTWLLCVELPIQQLFLGMCAHSGLTIYVGDATNAYAHSPDPNDTYLSIDDAYAEWYKDAKGVKISKRQVLPVYHALKGHPESSKMWMKSINNIIINQLGFCTITHDRCIYRWVQDGETQLLLRQVDNFLLGVENEQSARNLFNDIGKKIQFPTEVEQGIVPFEFLGIVKDYNGVDITQTPDYVEMSCRNYISRLLKSHGWDTTPKSKLESKNNIGSKSNVPIHTDDKFCAQSEIHDLTCARLETRAFLETSLKEGNHFEPLVPDMSDQNHNSNNFSQDLKINLQLPVVADTSMKLSHTMSPLPSDCIDQLYSNEGPLEGSNPHLLLEKLSGFLYCTFLVN